jgi:hypothetical protein
MSHAFQGSAAIPRLNNDFVSQRQPVRMAPMVELYSGFYPTPSKMLLLVESWLCAAERDGMDARSPEYTAALNRAIRVLRSSNTLVEAIGFLRSQEASLRRHEQ